MELIIVKKKDGYHLKINGVELCTEKYDLIDNYLFFHDKDKKKMAMINVKPDEIIIRTVNLDIIDNEL